MSLPRYLEYKDSGIPWIGDIPDKWSIAPLSAVAAERSERNSGMREDNLLSLSFGQIIKKDIDSNEGLLPESFETYQIIRAGDMILRLTDLQNDKRSLRSAIVREQGIITSAYLALTPTSIHPGFFSYLLRSYDLTKVFYSMGGGLRQSMKFSDLKRMPVVLPGVNEQIKIASFLDRETAKIDALIAEQEKLIALLAEKRQATISHAVTRGLNPDAPMKDSGVSWIGEVPAHWQVYAIRRFLSRIEQGWSPECFSRPAEGQEWGILKSGCVNGGVFDARNNKALPETLAPNAQIEVRHGDLLMSRASGSPALVGAVAYVEQPPPRLMLSDKIFRLHLQKNIFPQFFAIAFSSNYARYQIEQAISGAEGLANNLPQSSLKSFTFVAPPREEQQKIVTMVTSETSKLEALLVQAERAISLLRERRSALITAAVTGQIDVRDAAAQIGTEEKTEAI